MKNFALMSVFCLLSIQAFAAQAQNSKSIAPADQEDCTNQAAREAKTAAGLQIMVQNCRKTYPAERSPNGGYRYYDAELQRYVEVSGPKLSSSDLKKLDALRKQKIESDKVNRDNEAARNLAALMASAEKEKIARDIASQISINRWSVACGSNCYAEKSISIQVTNNSDKAISGIKFEYELAPNIVCDSQLKMANTFYKYVTIKPKETVNFIYAFDALSSSKISNNSGCLGVRTVDIAGWEFDRELQRF